MNVILHPPQPKKYFAQRFALWLGMVAMFMTFAGITSAYIVRQAQSDWLEIRNLPIAFFISTALIVLSSVTMILANNAYKKDHYNTFRLFLVSTFILGALFALFQVKGWQALNANNILLGGRDANPAGSFIYLLSGLHLLHLVMGLFFMLIAIIRSTYVFKNPAIGAVKEFAPQKGIRMDLLSTFWHFVDILWIYLLIFLLINK